MKSPTAIQLPNNLNIDNFLNLVKCCNSEAMHLVTISNRPILYITNKTAGLIENIPISAILTSIFYGDSANIMIEEIDATHTVNSTLPLQFSFLIVDRLAELPEMAFSGADSAKLCIKPRYKLDYKEYAYYLTSTDLLISSRLYQWLEMQFKKNEQLSFEYIFSNFPHLFNESTKENILKHILILISLGFIRPCSDNDDNLTSSNSKKADIISDKVDIAVLLADNVARKNTAITIKCQEHFYTLGIPDIAEQRIVYDFLHNTLSQSSWEHVISNDTYDLSPTKTALLKLKLYTSIKLSPAQLYENNFNKDGYIYIFSLMEVSFAKNLPVYRASGMDILDIAILSLLQIKKFTLDEISINVSKYTLSEIHRSIFGLIAIGLITVEKKRARMADNVEAIIRMTNSQQSTRSLLHKLINSIKSK